MNGGSVRLERAEGGFVDLADEAFIGRARGAALRIDDPAVHRFHAAVLSEDGELHLRALSRDPVLAGKPDVVPCRSCVIELDQVWVFGSHIFRVSARHLPHGEDAATRRSGIVWTEKGEATHVRIRQQEASIRGNAVRVLRILLRARGNWVEEDALIRPIWPDDLNYSDRRTRGNNLGGALTELRKSLDPVGLTEAVVSGSAEADGIVPVSHTRRVRTHVRLAFDGRVDRHVVEPTVATTVAATPRRNDG